jgi:hypothetical protein
MMRNIMKIDYWNYFSILKVLRIIFGEFQSIFMELINIFLFLIQKMYIYIYANQSWKSKKSNKM